jgi:hypothetical protein
MQRRKPFTETPPHRILDGGAGILEDVIVQQNEPGRGHWHYVFFRHMKSTSLPAEHLTGNGDQVQSVA